MIPESMAERTLQPHLAEPRAGLLNPNSAQPSQNNVGLWSGGGPFKRSKVPAEMSGDREKASGAELAEATREGAQWGT